MTPIPLDFIVSEWDLSSSESLNEALTKAKAALDHCQLELMHGASYSTNSIVVDREKLMDVVIDAINALDRIKHSYPTYSNVVNEYVVTHRAIDDESTRL